VSETPGALAGLGVVEIAHDEVAFCGKLLANNGADVVLVEPPGGAAARRYGPFAGDVPDPEGSLLFWHYHTSKRSLILDITSENDRRALLRLLDRADVMIESGGPGWLAANGLAYEDLRARNPRLVVGSVTPFGEDGPYAHHATTDITALAMGGVLNLCGYDDHAIPPIRPMGNQAWHTASHHLYMGVMLALIRRQRDGLGQRVHVSMHEVLSTTGEFQLPYWNLLGKNLLRQTGRHAYEDISEPNQFPTRDGGWVYMLLKADDAAWHGFLEWLREKDMVAGLDSPEFATRQSRYENFHYLAPLMAALAMQYDAEDFYHRAQAAGQPWAMIKAPDETMRDEHHLARGVPVEVEHPERGETYVYPGPPWRATGTPYRIRRRAPLLGEHTDEVLREAGLVE
jgi:crotonobetainyl-CoA:carnitine CoA-transferase CaiB-like acyl-CoA transferase